MLSSTSDRRLALNAVALFCALQFPNQALAYAKGLYKTQAEAKKCAKELEAMLHQVPQHPSVGGGHRRRTAFADGSQWLAL